MPEATLPKSPSLNPTAPFLVSFQGFEPLGANFLYCPNQFFDVCLPNCSRGVVRLVAFMLRKTLGWLDEDGNPIEEEVKVSYRDLIHNAGISRGAVPKALDEAVAGNFLVCTTPGRPDRRGESARHGQYMLRWDTGTEYVKETNLFQGFYAAQGHRTPIPNAFFDRILPYETLAIVKVVGSVLRHTVGYQTQFGRRPHAPLSLSYIQRYANIRDRSTVSQAVSAAIDKNYIACVQPGTFHFKADQRRPARYATKWLTDGHADLTGSETRPAKLERFRNPTSTGSESQPARRFKNPTKEKTTVLKNTDKQQRPAVAADKRQSYLLLRRAGFDEHTATVLSGARSEEQIQKQIEWLPLRNPKHPLAMLRCAIEGKWTEPDGVGESEHSARIREREKRHRAEQAAQHAAESEVVRRKRSRRERLLKEWNSGSKQDRARWIDDAVLHAQSHVVRRSIRSRSRNPNHPPHEALEAMARALAVPIGESP